MTIQTKPSQTELSSPQTPSPAGDARPITDDLNHPVYSQAQVAAHFEHLRQRSVAPFWARRELSPFQPRMPAMRDHPEPSDAELSDWPDNGSDAKNIDLLHTDPLENLPGWKTDFWDKYTTVWSGPFCGHQVEVIEHAVDDRGVHDAHPAWGEAQVSVVQDGVQLSTQLPLQYLSVAGLRRAVEALTSPGSERDAALKRLQREKQALLLWESLRAGERTETGVHEDLRREYSDVEHVQLPLSIGGKTVYIDEALLPAIRLLNEQGYRATFCCQGDARNSGYVSADRLPLQVLTAAMNAGFYLDTNVIRDVAPSHLQAQHNAAFRRFWDDYADGTLDETGRRYRVAYTLPELSGCVFPLLARTAD